ncbi:MAG: hypothetical protein Q3Y15_00230 [Candidatus Copromonas sp.]|nr:hypothetical protein [Candidatus Copromonas sp.]
MNKDKLILKDGSTIELEAGASLTALQVICRSADDVIPLWKRLTQENLQEVTVKNGADLIVGVYSEMVLIEPHIQATEQEDGTVKVLFGLREKTAEEKRLDALEEGQATQDGAIKDLGEATSDLAEQMEGVAE